jgi:hypothetical protein
MNDIESRLADAMAARAREVEPHDEDDALNRIAERVNMNRRRTFTILGVAAAIAVAVGTIALLTRDDKKTQQVNVATDSGNTTTTANTTPATVLPAGPTAIWPFASMNRTFATPEEAAKSFAVDYLGMTFARVSPVFEGVVDVFPNATGNARTAVHVYQESTGGWIVTGADADEITVDAPKPHDPLASSMTVSGKSVAFEATLGVELRPFGSTTAVFKDIAMGGGTEILPFATTITPPATDQPLVLVIFEGDASGQGAVIKATVIPLDPAGTPEPTTFVGQTTNGDLTLLDFAGHVQRAATAQEKVALETPATLPSSVSGSLPTLRGRFATVAFFDGSQISSYNPANGNVVQLVQPAAKPTSLDADESGRHLLWVDVNHDLWKWSGGDPVKVGSGFTSAAW